ncbi:MAG TPA: TonB-dependent receptor, partial [Thermoanaerobaculia bacterium]
MRQKFLLLLALLLVVTVPLLGQATTSGGVIGTITDSSGAALPGVTVELSGPAMQGTRMDVADARGQYRFLQVPPGENYRLTATLSGFAPVTKTINRVYLGQDATVDISMRAAVSEAITVMAEAPLVDVTKTAIGVNVTSRQFESLPTQRSFQQLTTLAPGVTLEMSEHDSRQLANSPNVGASSAPENNYIIDGLSTTDVRFGTSGTNLAMNFVEEVQVMTSGYSAECGRSTGGVFNVITKSGGNDFSGDVFGYYKNKSWSKEAPRNAGSGTTLLADLGTTKDFGVDVGGPIMRDRLWFFGAFDPTRRNVDVGGIRDDATGEINNTPTGYTERTNFYAGKMTWGIMPNHNVVVSAFGDPTHREGWLESAFFQSLDGAGRVADLGSKNLAGRYTGVLSQAWLIEGSLGRFTATHNRHALTEIGRTVPRQSDLFGGRVYGGNPAVFTDKESRNAYALKLTNFFGAHELHYGGDVEKNKYDEEIHAFNYVGFFATVPLKEGGREKRWVMSQREYSVNATGNTDNNAAFL